MSAELQPNVPAQEQAAQPSNKEYNFAQLRQQLEREKQEKAALQQELERARRASQERLSTNQDDEQDDNYDEPYVDIRHLEKKLNKFGQKTKQETDERINSAVQKALAEERRQMWLKNNPDFQEVMQHAQAFADRDPELAETILEMPEGFERQKLVYKNIKALGLHKPKQETASIQEKIDANRRSPYYQPTNMSAPGYGIVNGGKDYSAAEGKAAYAKLVELKQRISGHR